MVIVSIVTLLLSAGVSYRLYTKGIESQKMTVEVGPTQKKLKVCPEKPNCIVMSPSALKLEKSPINEIQKFLEDTGHTTIKRDVYYLHATFKSTVFGFIDDVEFFFDHEEKKLHFRSASRVGYSDLGVNKKRVKTVLKAVGLDHTIIED